jgi:GNAT superfamily N-acetyltransferase
MAAAPGRFDAMEATPARPSTPPPLEVWLEPGYADGRLGAWLVGVPGIFAVASNKERGLSAILTATGRVREWAESRGDDLGLGTLGRMEVSGETAAVVQPDGYEVNATFPWDRRPLSGDEVATAIRRLTWLDEDLQAVAATVDAFAARHGPLPADAETGERTSEAVLRHVAGAVAWYVGRLDGASRPGHPGESAAAALAADNAWARERLATHGAADDGREGTDEHGETWNLAKVVRRSLYHAFDHLWELERRLARADGTGDRVEVRLDRRPDAPTMAGLLRSVGWDGQAAVPSVLASAIDGTPEFAAAWDGDRLVGTARSLTDGALQALIATVVVHPRYQGLGVGERMMHALIDGHDGVRFALAAAPGMDAWYRKLGFVPDGRAMMRPRGRN